jgi:nucleoside-diphosphate-sugar epimerase
VRVLDDFSSGRRGNLERAPQWAGEGGGRLELIEADLRDGDVCARAMQGVRFVLHQAAVPSVQRSVIDPLTTHTVNALGTLQLLEAARQARVERFVLASSSSIYGESETLPKVETMAPDPISPYGLQKLTAESYGRLYHHLHGLGTIGLRYFNVFGPRQDPQSEYAAVIPRFLDAARAGRPVVIYGDGEQTRDFTFVSNVVQANLSACEAPQEALGLAYNVGSGLRISLNDLVGRMGAALGAPLRVEYAAARAGDIRHSLADIGRAQRLLGYGVEVDLDEGLARLIQAV